jgi:hypothetical protein
MGEKLTYVSSFVKAGAKHVLVGEKPIVPDNRYCLDLEHANAWIQGHLAANTPFMVGRMGSGEMLAFIKTIEVKLGLRKHIPQGNMDSLCINAGFFPEEEEKILQFGEEMEQACKQVDMLAIWGTIPMEPYLLKTRFRGTTLCKLSGIEPFFAEKPWSSALAGKKVLVIHPFETSIHSQYEKRSELFPNRAVLPDFELKTLKAVQTIAGQKDERFADWFEALQYMFDQAMSQDFDVAIIGCGAYGFPLAARLKAAGKQVIHMGGSTQLLFGIRGKRWDEKKEFQGLFNEAWCRPCEEEVPSQAKKIENSCYW